MRQGQKVENITVEVPCFLKKLREFGSLWIRSFAATVWLAAWHFAIYLTYFHLTNTCWDTFCS